MNVFSCRVRPKDARKPNFKSQSARTMYTNFDTRTGYFTVKILRDLEKSSNFSLRKTVFEQEGNGPIDLRRL